MITLFDEQDLVSFGMYMISEQRKDSIKNNPEITNNEVRKAILKTVTQFDFNNWLSLKMKSEQEEQENLEDNVTISDDENISGIVKQVEDEMLEVDDEDSKTIKMNSNN